MLMSRPRAGGAAATPVMTLVRPLPGTWASRLGAAPAAATRAPHAPQNRNPAGTAAWQLGQMLVRAAGPVGGAGVPSGPVRTAAPEVGMAAAGAAAARPPVGVPAAPVVPEPSQPEGLPGAAPVPCSVGS